MKKKTNNLNSILENIVNQYFGDFSLENVKSEKLEKPEKSKKEKKPILEKKETLKDQVEAEIKNNEVDPSMFLESLREDFFNMLNTTKNIEEKKELSDELEDIAKTFFK